MSRYRVQVQHIPTLGPEEVITYPAMRLRIDNLPVEWQKVKLDDYWFYAPSWNDWDKIIRYLQPKTPKYMPERCDCEFMSCWFYVHVCEEFKINTMARVQGLADLEDGKGHQRHAWNIFTDGKYFYQLEPQDCVIMDIDNPSYIPDEIVIG